MIDLRAMSRPILAAAFVLIGTFLSAQGTFQLAVLKYNGGGDWYANPTAVPNLVKFCNANIATNIMLEVPNVEVGSPDIFSYPWLDITGHGNIVFSAQEAQNLGVVAEVLPADQLMTRAREFAGRLAQFPRRNLRHAKTIMVRYLRHRIRDEIDMGLAVQGLSIL